MTTMTTIIKAAMARIKKRKRTTKIYLTSKISVKIKLMCLTAMGQGNKQPATMTAKMMAMMLMTIRIMMMG